MKYRGTVESAKECLEQELAAAQLRYNKRLAKLAVKEARERRMIRKRAQPLRRALAVKRRGEGKTFRAIGQELGVTASRARQMVLGL